MKPIQKRLIVPLLLLLFGIGDSSATAIFINDRVLNAEMNGGTVELNANGSTGLSFGALFYCGVLDGGNVHSPEMCSKVEGAKPIISCDDGLRNDRLPNSHDGLSLDVVWQRSLESIITGASGWDNSSTTSVPRVLFTSNDYSGPTDVDLTISCNFDFTGTGIDVYSVSDLSRHNGIFSVYYRFRLNFNPVVTVSEPTPISGSVGDVVTSGFTVDINVPSNYEETALTWDVQEPCRNWSPLLINSSSNETPPIGINHNEIMLMSKGMSDMKASFSPTTPGAFTCPGELTFNFH
ncbi:hypothetical protein [Serratia odorifera]|uniref:hypothetical protein n=1 Tax=Serratia odorifera TaxID=618 RepID=UPI0018E6EC75|nr:hypothetical protein [Serratia odorifera]MBJ2067206.1 hypothetical protein [Serratia odorifera]